LLAAVQQQVVNSYGSVSPEQPRLTRERHQVAVLAARDELVAFRAAWDAGRGVPAIIAAVHVRAAVHALDELIGVVSLNDVLDRLFAEFCVGK
jgi:tRNA modification GTPase